MVPSPPDLSVSRLPAGKIKSSPAIRGASDLLRFAFNSDRLRILLLLACEDRTASDLVGQFPGQSEQFVGRHLRLLRRSGLVERWGVGAFRVYALTEAGRDILHAFGGTGDE